MLQTWWPSVGCNPYVVNCGLGGQALSALWCTSQPLASRPDAPWMKALGAPPRLSSHLQIPHPGQPRHPLGLRSLLAPNGLAPAGTPQCHSHRNLPKTPDLLQLLLPCSQQGSPQLTDLMEAAEIGAVGAPHRLLMVEQAPHPCPPALWSPSRPPPLWQPSYLP